MKCTFIYLMERNLSDNPGRHELKGGRENATSQ